MTTLTSEILADLSKHLNAHHNGHNSIFNITESLLLVVDGEPHEAPRTWKERLFTLPWSPFKRTKTITPKVPDPNVYFVNNGLACIAHPETARTIRETLKERLNYDRSGIT